MARYVIVSFLDPKSPDEFMQADWPLHVTLLSPFSTELSAAQLTELLKNSCSGHRFIEIKGKSRELFGDNADIPVTTLESTTAIQLLQAAIKSSFLDSIEFTWPEYPTFQPHVTDKHDKGIDVGDLVLLDAVSLVELRDLERSVIATCQLD